MADLADGESTEMKGSGAKPYVLKNTGGVYSCTCPAWMHQSLPIERRTCKHLRALRGDEAETARVGAAALSGKPPKAPGVPAASATADGPPVLLAHKWENDVDLTGWWMSEKLDGVRAYWDGAQFLSRLGNVFHAPDWFIAGFPNTPLDGELWGGRKLFQRTVGIVKRQDKSEHWKELSYVVFDAPAHPGTFEERIAHLEATLPALKLEWVRIHSHAPCSGTPHLKEELARVEALGGEGLMMRRPGSKYEVGRSSSLLKVKSFHDTEARVLAHVAGLGKNKGRLGSLLVELPDGTRFNVGTGFTDAERAAPPAIGSIITFRYQELSNAGVPRFPSYVGERIDGAFTPTAPKPKGAAPASAPSATAPAASPGPAAASPEAKAPGAKPPPVSAPPPAAKPPAKAALAAQYFELIVGGSRKFWEVKVDDTLLTTRTGRIGAAGQVSQESFPTGAAALAQAQALISEKTAKGYAPKSAGPSGTT
jgi:DNA ligase-1